MISRRRLTRGPDNAPLWVQLYGYPVGEQWAAVILADRVPPPKPDEVKGIGSPRTRPRRRNGWRGGTSARAGRRREGEERMPPGGPQLDGDRRPGRWRGLVLAALTALHLTGCAGLPASGGGAARPPTIEAPVLSPGDTWTFRYDDGPSWRQAYAGPTVDGLLRGLGPTAGAEYYYDQTHTVRRVRYQGVWRTAATPDFPEIGFAPLRFPLTVGKTWTNEGFSAVDVLSAESYRVVGCEAVPVPAGTFVAVRIAVSQSYTRAGVTGRREFTLWYAPRVKYWVKRAAGGATFWDPVRGWALESFTIDPGPPARQ